VDFPIEGSFDEFHGIDGRAQLGAKLRERFPPIGAGRSPHQSMT
jgi:hypothetical protein